MLVACTKYHFSVFPEAEKQHKGETEIQVKVRVAVPFNILYLQEVFWGGKTGKKEKLAYVFFPVRIKFWEESI